MADFRPFKALRYDLEHVSLEEVIAPPYDVISPSGQDRLYQKSPHNCIRLILNREDPRDSENSSRYTRARDFLHDWIQNGVLIEEEEPAFYLYRQTFTDLRSGKTQVRIALFGRLKLEPFEKGIVIAHEKTLSKPKQDRRKLLESTQTNLSAVFGLYEDPDKKIRALLASFFAREADLKAADEEKVLHEVWVLRDPKVLDALSAGIAPKNVYIADGHHRYQTALDYSLARHEQEKVPAARQMPYDFVLMALVAFEDAGIVLYPTHRMVSLESFPALARDPGKAVELLRPFFDIQAAPAEKLTVLLESAPVGMIQLGLLLGGKSWLLRLKDWRQAKTHMSPGKPDVWYQLDVAVLSHMVLGHLWKIPESQWEALIRYTHADGEALGHAEKNPDAAVFLLKAPRVQILGEMGRAGELMPQKSTYFYPKLASGLVFHSLKLVKHPV